jgi:hypothetical protein
MSYKNPKELMDAATALPVAIEERLPEGAPKLSEKLLDFNAKVLSKAPDFLVELPDLPAVPEIPAGPTGLRRYVSAVEVRETRAPVRQTKDHALPNPVGQVSREIIEKRGF